MKCIIDPEIFLHQNQKWSGDVNKLGFRHRRQLFIKYRITIEQNR